MAARFAAAMRARARVQPLLEFARRAIFIYASPSLRAALLTREFRGKFQQDLCARVRACSIMHGDVSERLADVQGDTFVMGYIYICVQKERGTAVMGRV